MVKGLGKRGKGVILVLNEGGGGMINDIEGLGEGVINIMVGSKYGGDGLGNVMCGDGNFSGKMGLSYAKYINGIGRYD